MKTQYDSHTEVLKKRNDSLLEDCERHREVGFCLLSMQVSFFLIFWLFDSIQPGSGCVVIDILTVFFVEFAHSVRCISL